MTRWVHMQIRIQSGAGQKALEFPYELYNLALCRINPESKWLSAGRFACAVAVETLHVET